MTEDQLAASKRRIKHNPYSDPKLREEIRSVIKKHKEDNTPKLECSLKSDNEIIAVIVSGVTYVSKDRILSVDESHEIDRMQKQYIKAEKS